MRWAWIVLLVPFLMGCTTPTEEDLTLIETTRQAGEYVATHPTAPEDVKQAGLDAANNMVVVQERLGLASDLVQYDPAKPDEQEARREAARVAHTLPPPIVRTIGGALDGWIPGASAALGIGIGVWQALGKRKATRRLRGTYAAIEDTAAKVGNGEYKAAIKTGIAEYHRTAGLFKDVKSDLADMGLSKG